MTAQVVSKVPRTPLSTARPHSTRFPRVALLRLPHSLLSPPRSFQQTQATLPRILRPARDSRAEHEPALLLPLHPLIASASPSHRTNRRAGSRGELQGATGGVHDAAWILVRLLTPSSSSPHKLIKSLFSRWQHEDGLTALRSHVDSRTVPAARPDRPASRPLPILSSSVRFDLGVYASR